MWEIINRMPVHRARCWALIYFNLAVWVVVGGLAGLGAWAA